VIYGSRGGFKGTPSNKKKKKQEEAEEDLSQLTKTNVPKKVLY
jgi:hypothetical protein